MFVTEETTLGLPLDRVLAQLNCIIVSGGLGEASDHAYGAGVALLTRVGPLGGIRGLAKTVQVRVYGPSPRMTGVAYALRWVATGPAGGLFPALDADLMLARVDARRTRLSVIACYRPPLGTLGVQLDRMLLGRVARATLRSLLDSLAEKMTQPPGSDGDGRYSPGREPAGCASAIPHQRPGFPHRNGKRPGKRLHASRLFEQVSVIGNRERTSIPARSPRMTSTSAAA